MYESISIDNLKKLNNIDIIDIRSIQKYNDGHIENAINIPFKILLLSPSKYLQENVKYYIYCQTGNMSRKLCNILNNYGYNVINILGGYDAWILYE